MKLLILTDYREQLYSSVRASTVGIRLDLLCKRLKELDIESEIMLFRDVDLSLDYADKLVIYQSSEDRDLFYKSYIEDIMLALQEKGAILIPDYKYLRCHHNKAFQEMLRKTCFAKEIRNLNSLSFGSYEDLLAYDRSKFEYPLVIKKSGGCCSKGVALAENEHKLLKIARGFSRSFNLSDYLRFTAKTFLRKGYIAESSNRNKFILQQFIFGLEDDYKVLFYGDKAYVLRRFTRKNDFRASGSGSFEYPEKLPEGLLEGAEKIYKHFNVPFISLDMAYSSKDMCFYLIEFQFLMFGTLTLEYSKEFYQKINNKWEKQKGTSILEEVIADSLHSFIKETQVVSKVL